MTSWLDGEKKEDVIPISVDPQSVGQIEK